METDCNAINDKASNNKVIALGNDASNRNHIPQYTNIRMQHMFKASGLSAMTIENMENKILR